MADSIDIREAELTQKQYTTLTTEANEILYGGAAGGGKSHLMRYASIIWCLMIPGLQVYLFRRKYADLEKNHLYGPTGYTSLLHQLEKEKKVKINYSHLRIDFSNGSQIYLSHCQHEKDVENYRGAEIHVLMIDELTHFSKSMYTFLRGRVRLGGLKVDYSKLKKYFPYMDEGFFPRILCGTNPGGIGHCIPYGDVLTANGWKPIQDVVIGEEVYSVTSERKLVLKNVEDTVKFNISEDLNHVKTRGFELICTDKHKIPYFTCPKKDSTKFSLKEFKDLPYEVNVPRSVDWYGMNYEFFEILPVKSRKRKYDPIYRIKYRDYAELMGWYLSEGCFTKSSKGKRFEITQTKEYNREKIINLLDRIGFRYSKNDPKTFAIYYEEWVNYFSKFGKCRDKFIPKQLKNSSDIDILFNALIDGDGIWISEDSGHYYTTSKQLADDVQEVALKLGYIVSVTQRQRINRKGLSYEVNFHKNKIGGSTFYNGNNSTVRNSVTKKPFSGDVYCLTIPDTHTFILRQNGCISVTGNSWVKAMFVDSAPPETIHIATVSDGGMRRIYIPALLYENPYLLENDPEYGKRLKGLNDKHLVNAMLTGDWDIIAGGALDDIWRREKHIKEEFIIPDDWYINRSFDWGSAKPYACCWWAESNGNPIKLKDGTQRTYPRGTLFLIGELYGWNGEANEGARISTREQGKAIFEYEVTKYWGSRVRNGPADSAIFDKTYQVDDQESMHDHLVIGYNNAVKEYNKTVNRSDKNSFHNYRHKLVNSLFYQADKSPGSRIKGLEMIRTYLKASLNEPMEDKGLFIFDKCTHFIRTVPVIPRDEKNPEDVDTEAEDHIFDATRYRVYAKYTDYNNMKVKGL